MGAILCSPIGQLGAFEMELQLWVAEAVGVGPIVMFPN